MTGAARARERVPRDATRAACGAFPDLSRLLSPRSIAVIGASDRPGNLGAAAIRRLRKFAYAGEVWPVNPGRESVEGLPCFPNVARLPRPADLAIFAVPAAGVSALVVECAAAGIHDGVAWAGGFAEIGADGVRLQAELRTTCREHGFRLVGPNCVGIINTQDAATATFASFLAEIDHLVPGHISVISQSGGVGTMAQSLALRAGFGFRYMISSGNEVVLTAADFIHAATHDAETHVIGVYLEGADDGERLIAALTEARHAAKPVVLMKGGASAASARAAVAHTAALVGEDRVWSAVLDELAVIRVRSLEELLDVTLYLSSLGARAPRGDGVALVSFGGAPGVLSADQCDRAGLTTPVLAARTREALRPLVPAIAATGNPVDLTPQAFNDPAHLAHLPEALDLIAADPAIDTVLAQFGPMEHGGVEAADALAALARRADKAVCVVWPLAPIGIPARLREAGFAVFDESARAISVLGKLVQHHRRLIGSADDVRAELPPERAAWPSVQGPAVFFEPECHAAMAAAGLGVAPGRLASTEGALRDAVAAVGLPVAMKGISPAVLHRDAAGLVALDVRSEAQALEVRRTMLARAAALGVDLRGIYVQRMVGGGLELLVSAFRDPTFGPIVSCGAGGTLTEVVNDVVLMRAPVDHGEAERLLGELRIVAAASHRPDGPRLEDLARFVVGFSQLAAVAPWRRFVCEVNPVKWSGAGVVAVDGLLTIDEP